MTDADNGDSGQAPNPRETGLSGPSGSDALPNSSSYAQHHFAQNVALQEQLRNFWGDMTEEVDAVGTDPAEFKSQQLPLARIKKIMKSDEDVRMISAEAPVLFAKACEFFILEMTIRAWNAAEEHKRRTLQRGDIATAISRTEIWDFLLDTVPLEGDVAAAVAQGDQPGGAAAAGPGAAPAAPQAGAPQPGGVGVYPGQFLPPMNPGMAPMGNFLPPGAMLFQPGMFMQQPQGQYMAMPGMPPGMQAMGQMPPQMGQQPQPQMEAKSSEPQPE